MKKDILNISKAIVLGLVLSVGVGYLSAAWSEPAAGTVPPNNNTDAPINIGALPQGKSGLLTTNGGLITTAFRLIDGTPTDDAGKVLTSNASGVATWEALSGSGSVSLVSGTPTTSYAPNTWTSVVTLANDTNVKACFITQIKHYNTDSGNNFNCEVRPPSMTGTPGLWQLVSESGTNENTTCKALCIQ